MATEPIGNLIPTAIPGYTDAADIQAALRAYHYGSYSYNPSNTSAASLVNPSMAKTIYDIQQDIVSLENRPSSGGDVSTTAPVPGDFTPSGIPNGYIWVDQDGTIGGGPISATSIYTNDAPTSALATGLIWVDKDPTVIGDNPFIPTSLISNKGDIIVGLANDSASVLYAPVTNGLVITSDSSTATGLVWSDSSTSTQTLTNKSISLASNTLTGTIAQFNTAVTDADFATVSGTETLTNKTLTSANLTAPVITGTASIWQMMENATVSAIAATGTVNYNVLDNGAVTYYTSNASGNWTLNVRGSATTSLDSIMSTGKSLTIAFLVTQGSPAYYQTAFQVDGVAVVPKWQNAAAPSSGNANSIDIYSITIIKTGSAAFTAIASQTRFA